MNAEKIKQLRENAVQVRTGGKGTVRRKKKIGHRLPNTDEKKLANTVKRIEATNIPGIEEVNLIKHDGTVIHFTNPRVQAAVPANTFVVVGGNEQKKITDLLPDILNQLGPESLGHLKTLADSTVQRKSGDVALDDEDDDEIPALVGDFDEPSKHESYLENLD